jgi:translation initiation factor IF-2
MLKPEERETIGGHAEVRKVFRISRVGNIAGCYVRDGTVLRSHRVRLVRDGTVVFTGRIASLRREKDDIKEAREGFECGIRIEGYDDVKVGDVIETFQIEKIARTLGSSQGGPAAPASPA